MPKGKVSPFLKQCFVSAAVCINIVGHSAAIGYTAILLPQLHQENSAIPLTKEDDSWITSSLAITMLIGNFITPSIMDRLGRRAAHLAVCVPSIIGWIVTAMSSSILELLLGRVFLGLSYGMLLPLRSVLIGEYTSPKNRGAFLTTVSLAHSGGIFLVHLIGSALSWQMTALICAVFPFISVVMTIYSPESPSYLAARGKYEECERKFRWLRGDEEEEELEDMIQARKEARSEEKKKMSVGDFLAILKKREFYIPILIMIHANGTTHASGGPLIASFSTVVIGNLVGSAENVAFWMLVLDTQRIFFNGLAVYVINKFKRRTMLMLTLIMCILSQIAIALYVYTKQNGTLTYSSIWLPVFLINFEYFTIAIGIVPLQNVIAGEIFPLQYRSVAGSISIVSIAVFLFLVLKTFPGLLDSCGLDGAYLVYAACMAYCTAVLWFILPETKDKTLQQIEDEFTGRKKIVEKEMLELHPAKRRSIVTDTLTDLEMR